MQFHKIREQEEADINSTLYSEETASRCIRQKLHTNTHSMQQSTEYLKEMLQDMYLKVKLEEERIVIRKE